MNGFARIGRPLIALGTGMGEVLHLLLQTLGACRQIPRHLRHVTGQIAQIGADSLPLISVMALFVGMVLALQSGYQLRRYGAAETLGTLVGLSMVRELGPVLTALLVGGRVGSGITAELGSMKVTEQIDAMRALGANPIKKLVVPRVLTAMLVLPLLTLVADVLGILGGMVISQWEFNVDYHFYLNTVLQNLKLADLLSGLGKTVFFGFIIGIVGCYEGLETKGGTEGLGRATTAAVVTSALLILISDFFLTKFFWWLEGW